MKKDSIKAAIDNVENDSCIVIHSCEVDKFRGEKEKFDRRILLLTNISVIFFKNGSRPKQVCCEYWADLVGINGLSKHEQIITLIFKQDKYRFKISDIQEIKSLKLKLGDLFQRIFTLEELESRNIHKSDLYQISCRSIQNSFGQYSRFISYVKANNADIEKETEKRFFTYLIYHQKEIVFPKKIKSVEFESFMYGVDALSFVESIIFYNISNVDIFQQLNNFYSTLFENPSKYINKDKDKNDYFQIGIHPNVRHILFKKLKMTKNFDDFIRLLANGQIEHNLTGLSFENMKLIENDFYSIDKFCRSINSSQNRNKLRSLSFNSSLKEDQYNYFLSSFLNNDTTRYLAMLSLNETFNLTLPILFDKIRNITSLSLADCDINIISTLQCINRSRMYNLRMLDLSGNFCSKSFPPNFELNRNQSGRRKKSDAKFIGERYNPNDDVEFNDDDIVFPPSLTVLYVRNVKWGQRYKSLTAFLQAASSFRSKANCGFHLSIRGIKGGSFSDIKNEDIEFNNSFSHFNELNSYLAGFFTNIKKSHITHLDWAGNPVSYEFINFLSKSRKLVELDVSYCFSAELEENEARDPNSNSLMNKFSQYLINDAKKLESLIICGNTKTINDDKNSSKKKNTNEKMFLSQNLSGHSIYPLFQAIKQTKNPLSYINIKGQLLENPDGLNIFSDSIEANPNIQKVSFKNTGFETKEQFNYFVSKAKRKKGIFVEWPSEEMKNIQFNDINYYKTLLINLSKEQFYYESKNQNDSISSEKVSQKNRKSGDNSDSSQREDNDSDSYSDSEYKPNIRFDKLIYGKNLMARKIEVFQFDTDKAFPLYLSKEVEDLLDLPVLELSDDDQYEESEEVKKKSKSKKEKNSDKSEVESEVESEDEESSNKKSKESKKSNKESKRKMSAKKDSDESDSKSDEDDDRNKNSKEKRKSNQKTGKEKESKRKVKIEDDSDEISDDTDDEDDILDHKQKYLVSKSKKKKNVSDSDSYSYSEDESDEGSNKEWKFPSGIIPSENSDNKKIKKIKEKFSLENLMNNLVNGCG